MKTVWKIQNGKNKKYNITNFAFSQLKKAEMQPFKMITVYNLQEEKQIQTKSANKRATVQKSGMHYRNKPGKW